MYAGIKGIILAVAVVLVLGGCSPIGEPWDSTGKFQEERTQSEDLQEQLRHRAAHTQRGV